jgi:hypothetical protein
MRAKMCDLIDRVDNILLANEPVFVHCMFEEDDRGCRNLATVADIETGAEYCSLHFKGVSRG